MAVQRLGGRSPQSGRSQRKMAASPPCITIAALFQLQRSRKFLHLSIENTGLSPSDGLRHVCAAMILGNSARYSTSIVTKTPTDPRQATGAGGTYIIQRRRCAAEAGPLVGAQVTGRAAATVGSRGEPPRLAAFHRHARGQMVRPTAPGLGPVRRRQ